MLPILAVLIVSLVSVSKSIFSTTLALSVLLTTLAESCCHFIPEPDPAPLCRECLLSMDLVDL